MDSIDENLFLPTEADGTVDELRSHINDYEDIVRELEAKIQRRDFDMDSIDENIFYLYRMMDM
jgi:hypothetical protein